VALLSLYFVDHCSRFPLDYYFQVTLLQHDKLLNYIHSNFVLDTEEKIDHYKFKTVA